MMAMAMACVQDRCACNLAHFFFRLGSAYGCLVGITCGNDCRWQQVARSARPPVAAAQAQTVNCRLPPLANEVGSLSWALAATGAGTCPWDSACVSAAAAYVRPAAAAAAARATTGAAA